MEQFWWPLIRMDIKLKLASYGHTCSASITTMRRPRISWSDSLENRTRAHLLWIGSIILEDVLQARANRVELEYISIVRLKACCAPDVMLNSANKLPAIIWSNETTYIFILLLKKKEWKINLYKSKTLAYLSASSRITILWRPGGRVTFFWANILILFLTTSIPLHYHQKDKVLV